MNLNEPKWNVGFRWEICEKSVRNLSHEADEERRQLVKSDFNLVSSCSIYGHLQYHFQMEEVQHNSDLHFNPVGFIFRSWQDVNKGPIIGYRQRGPKTTAWGGNFCDRGIFVPAFDSPLSWETKLIILMLVRLAISRILHSTQVFL